MRPVHLMRAAMLSLALLSSTASRAEEAVKVVYHLSEGLPQASRALGNIRNHLAAEPQTKIVVVTHGPGIDFLLDGAVDAKGSAYSAAVADLVGKGVAFKVCNNTLTARQIPKENVIMEAAIVPSGVAEVGKLQAREQFVYLRP